MSNLQLNVFNETIRKLGIPNDHRLASKSLEIQELIKAKSSDVLKHINDNARIVLCIHISSELLNIPIESSNDLIKLSSLSKAAYNKNRNFLLKILDLNKKITIDEIIRKLGITHAITVEKSAKQIFKFYIEQKSFENQDIDPSVYAMSVYFACKAENVKIAKKNILTLSNLTQGQWTIMEKAWQKWAPTVAQKKNSDEKENSKKNFIENVENDSNVESNISSMATQKSKQDKETEESYDAWAKRILTQAYEELNK